MGKKRDTSILLTASGYLLLSGSLGISWIKGILFPHVVTVGDISTLIPVELSPELTTAWIAWTASLITWIIAKKVYEK